MKIFFDARYVRTDFHDGISRYSVELGTALARLDEVTFLISDEKQRKWFPEDSKFLKIHAGTSLKEPWTARILNRYKPDAVYSPMQTMGLGGKKFKAILTIHDMIYYRHKTPPRHLPVHIRFGWRLYHASYIPQRIALRRADLIATVSENSAQELKKAKMTKAPIIIVPNAPQKFTNYPVVHEDMIKNIVYMGSFMPYKNVETLIKGMEWLPGRTLHLLSRISPKRQTELEKIIPAKSSVVFHNGVTDNEYEKILSDNAILATASLDEGYGIPVAEALAMGVPAAVSDIPIFHEVGANGAVYFDPYQPQDFARAIVEFDDKVFRDQHVALGKTHIQNFSWDTSALQLYKAIQELIK